MYLDSEHQSWEQFLALRTIRCSYQEAEALQVHLGWLRAHLPGLRAQLARE